MSEYKPEPGTWRLISPSGAEYEADSPMHCVRAWTNANVPADVQLQRIYAMCAPTLEDKAELDAHMQKIDDFAFEAGCSAIAVSGVGVLSNIPDHAVLRQKFNEAREAVRASALKLMGISDE